MKTFAIIKPNVMKHYPEIMNDIRDTDLDIVDMKILTLNDVEVAMLYKEHEGQPFYHNLVNFMLSGPVTILCLEGDNAIQDWRKLIGPTKGAQIPTLRGKYGDPSIAMMNGFHGSDSEASAERELNIFFCQD